MARRTGIAITITLLLAAAVPSAFGAPCVVACRDEVAACRNAECVGLKGKVRVRCRRACKTQLMKDCFLDLSVCGATTARPSRPSAPSSVGGGGGW